MRLFQCGNVPPWAAHAGAEPVARSPGCLVAAASQTPGSTRFHPLTDASPGVLQRSHGTVNGNRNRITHAGYTSDGTIYGGFNVVTGSDNALDYVECVARPLPRAH